MSEPELCHPDQAAVHHQLPDYIDRVNGWQLVTGTVKLFIAGVPAKAWFPVSRPNSSGPATPGEYRIAESALRILRTEHYNDSEAGHELIRKVLRRVGWEPDEFTRYPKES